MLKPSTSFLVTGAASGIGKATCELLISEGHRVAVCDVDAEAAGRFADSLGAEATAIGLDVRDPAQWERALDAAWERLGGLDVLIGNAGLVHTGYSHELSHEKLMHMIDVNVKGVINGVRATVPRFLAQGHGHVINTGSLAAFVPMAGMAAYAASKHAVRAFTHGCALELRHRPVDFTVVCPPAVETPMLDQQIDDDAAVLSFADKSVSAQTVARAMLQAAERRPREILIPAARGRMLRFLGLFPGAISRMLDGAERRGRRELARRRQRA